MLLQKQQDWEVEELKNAKILNRNYGYQETFDEVILKSTVTVCQRIDQQQPVYISNDEVVNEQESWFILIKMLQLTELNSVFTH